MTVEPFVPVSVLAVWVQEEIAEDDAYANMILAAATVAVLSYADMEPGEEGSWDASTAPSRIKDIVAGIAKRNWINPSRLTREGSIGPIGGDSYVAAMAAGMELTDYEMSEIARLSTGATPGAGSLSILTFTTGRGYPNRDEPMYLHDSAGVGIPYLDRSQDPYYFPTVD